MEGRNERRPIPDQESKGLSYIIHPMPISVRKEDNGTLGMRLYDQTSILNGFSDRRTEDIFVVNQ